MPLDFDSSRAPLTSRDFISLALAVKKARDSDEADWIEWKSILELASADGKASLARGIVGLANRSTSTAATHCEGRSYFLIGVQPGELVGIVEVDPAVLEDRLRPYLGDDGPRFAPHWVSVEDRTVLIIEVAAPRDGDPVHHIRKEGPGVRDGDIFVRRGAKTVRASSVELQRLFQRSKNASELHGLTLALAEPHEVATIDLSPHAVEGWVAATRRRLLASLPPPDAEERAARHLGSFPRESAISDLAEVQREMARGLAGALSRRAESRTPEQYRDEVEKYLESCREALPYVALRAAGEKLKPVKLEVSNETEENYSAVQVVLHMPGTVEAARPSGRASNEGRLPAPPRPFGPYVEPIFGARGQVSRLSQMIAESSANIFLGHNNKTVDIVNGGSVTLTFSPTDLRPLEREVPLAPVVLLPQVPLDRVVTATWRATSKSVRGVIRGSLEIPLAEHPTPIRELAEDEEP